MTGQTPIQQLTLAWGKTWRELTAGTWHACGWALRSQGICIRTVAHSRTVVPAQTRCRHCTRVGLTMAKGKRRHSMSSVSCAQANYHRADVPTCARLTVIILPRHSMRQQRVEGKLAARTITNHCPSQEGKSLVFAASTWPTCHAGAGAGLTSLKQVHDEVALVLGCR